ncbi:MAG TPA: hypothetical protein VF407_09805, partial [Polyangiaceae bacterium]
ASNGLFEASSADLSSFTQKSSIQVQCLATSGTRLYACSVESSGFVVGASDDDGTTFAPLLHLNTLRGPLACPSGSSGSICVSDWPSVAANLGENLDGGSTVDAGTSGPAPTSKGSGCGCDLAADKTKSAGAAAAVAAALTALVIRRKKKRIQRS